MIAVLSPSKTLNEKEMPDIKTTEPLFKKESAKLVTLLKKYSVRDLMDLMRISENLAEINFIRFKNFKKSPKYPASLLFQGDVWKGVDASDFTETEIEYAKEHIFILSGLYGVLRFNDAICPYRLEMGTKLKNDKGDNLYEFWGDKVFKKLIEETGAKTLINLASKEYSRVLKLKNHDINVIEVEFLEKRHGQYVQIPLFSKTARGLMARFMAKNSCKAPKDLKEFDLGGYEYSYVHSDSEKYVFVR